MEENKVSKKQQACVNRYISKAYDRVNLTLPKGEKEKIKAHADIYDGGSVNAFIQRAIKETMERDAQTVPGAEAEE